ncbi:MAG: hypothetical protein IJS88_01885, partial [Alphaproteobacteria bacterium]|nr:hypothetical protein [Alphaproteobacteria bacterium]
NNQLTSLQGAPQEVGGSFRCENNQLTSLEGAPQKVGGYFSCQNNQLTSLQGAPQEVGGSFLCNNNQLTSLEGAPQEVGGHFLCQNNQLTSLQGAPQEVGGKIKVDINISAQYSFNDGEIKLDDLKNSPLYREEIFISEKSKELRRKVLRTIAAENVSPEKGVVNKKRTAGEKNAIKQILDGIGKSIDK